MPSKPHRMSIAWLPLRPVAWQANACIRREGGAEVKTTAGGSPPIQPFAIGLEVVRSAPLVQAPRRRRHNGAPSQTRAPGNRLSATIRSRSLSNQWRSIAHSHHPANAAAPSARPEPRSATLPCDREPPSGAHFGAPLQTSRKPQLQRGMPETPQTRNHGAGAALTIKAYPA